jgi:hypothetical protein
MIINKLNWNIVKHSIIVLIDLILTVSGLFSVLTIYKIYETTLLFYFLLYNIIISLFSLFHFFKVIKDMVKEKLKDVVYIKIKLFLMITSFIWGIIILEHKNIILYYQNNYPRVYISFINYFILSSLSILDVIYKILYHICKKNNNVNQVDYDFMVKIDNEYKDEYKDNENL